MPIETQIVDKMGISEIPRFQEAVLQLCITSTPSSRPPVAAPLRRCSRVRCLTRSRCEERAGRLIAPAPCRCALLAASGMKCLHRPLPRSHGDDTPMKAHAPTCRCARVLSVPALRTPDLRHPRLEQSASSFQPQLKPCFLRLLHACRSERSASSWPLCTSPTRSGARRRARWRASTSTAACGCWMQVKRGAG